MSPIKFGLFLDLELYCANTYLSFYILQMKKNIAEAINISEEDISIKATTNEKLGFIGREEGVVAYAVCLIEKP